MYGVVKQLKKVKFTTANAKKAVEYGRAAKSAYNELRKKKKPVPTRNARTQTSSHSQTQTSMHVNKIIKSTAIGGITRSVNQITYHKPKALHVEEKYLAPTTVQRQDGKVCSGTLGAQTITSMALLAGNVSDTVGSIGLSSSMQYALNYVNGSAGSALTIESPVVNGQKFILDRVETTIQIFNATSVGGFVDIYDLKSKVTSATYVDPIQAWFNGTNNQQYLSSIPQNDCAIIGSVPTQSKDFNIAWSIVKRTKVELGPGCSHEHKFIFTPNIVIDSEYINTYKSIKNLTCAQFIVQRGTLGDTNTTGSVTLGTVSTNAIKLDCVISTQLKLRPITVNSRNLVIFDNLLKTGTLTDVTQTETSGPTTYS